MKRVIPLDAYFASRHPRQDEHRVVEPGFRIRRALRSAVVLLRSAVVL